MEKSIGKRYEGLSATPGLRYGIIEVTSYCQCRCPGCYMVSGQRLNQGKMPIKKAIAILDRCREYLGRELETMDILGGDPLLWPPLKDYLQVLLARGIKPWLFTNMLAITPEMAGWLRERDIPVTGKLNIDPSDVSLLPLQARMLGGGLPLARRLLAAISVFREAGYKAPLFRLQNLIRKENITFVPAYYRWCLENEIGTDLEMMGSGESISQEYWAIAPRPEEIAAMIREIQAVRFGFGLPPGEVLMPHIFGSCPFFDRGLYFALDGSIRACSNSSTLLSNLSDPDPIRKACESELICRRLALSQEKVGMPCRDCAKWEKCRGGCRATAEGTGGYESGYPLCPVPYLT